MPDEPDSTRTFPDNQEEDLPLGANGRSGIVEHVFRKADEEANPRGEQMVMPVMLDVSVAREYPGVFRISAGMGYVPTSEEFWTFVDHVARFYWVFDDSEIIERNKATYLKWQQHEEESKRRRPRAVKERKVEEGYVYLLGGTELNDGKRAYKIGRAKDPTKRTEVLKTQLPMAVEIVCTLWSEDYKALEKRLHEHFSSQRLNGEWFELSQTDVKYVKELVA